MKKGILLINLGTPKSPTAKHLRPYLRRFLGDKRVIATPDVIWKPVLELMILPRRPKFSAQMYKKIWSAEYGSPLAYYTKRQAELLQALVPDTVVKYAFSYSEPDISQVLAEFEAQKVTELCIIALYPQYSTTTVGSVSWEKVLAISDLRVQKHIFIMEKLYLKESWHLQDGKFQIVMIGKP